MYTIVEFIKIHPEAIIPAFSTPGASGLDLTSIETAVLAPGQRKLFSTGLKVSLEHGWEGQVRPRSGLALNKGITVLNAPGTIDSDYQGALGVILINLSDKPVTINAGERIAQLVVAEVETQVRTKVVSQFSKLPTARAENGFGSTGI